MGPLERLFIATYTLLGFAAQSFPISDNSAFAHLRTGRLIADTGAIPRVDPYSATAAGHRWVVQSWLPEWTYGWLWRLGGLHLVVLEQAVLGAAIAFVIALLARAGSSLRTAAAAGLALGVGIPLWAPRPLLFGILGLAVLILLVERRANPLWVLPLVWVWVNSHGSFPLGVVWLTATVAGMAWDRGSLAAAWSELGRYVVAFVVGLGLAALNPLGPRLLAFPFTLGDKRSVFRLIVEWQSPDFQSRPAIIALAFVGLCLVLLFRARTCWQDVLPAAGFLVLALVALRNLPMLAVVLAPVMGRTLQAPGSSAAAVRDGDRRTPVFAGAIVAAIAVFGAGIWSRPALEVEGYPVAAVEWLSARGHIGTGRVAHQDVPGGYLILRYGTGARVFIDDRVDMYPLAVSRDYVSLLHGRPDALEVLRRHHIDVVLWQVGRPLEAILDATATWERTFEDERWVVFERRSESGAGTR